MESIKNCYQILDVPYNATFTEIKEAYRKKVKELHPDKEKGNADQFKRVKEAYEILNTVEKRKRHDEALFKTSHNDPHNLKQEHTPKTNSSITILSIKRKNRKQVSRLPVMINAAVLLIGVLVNTYRKGKR
ncbi:J domain-containing protein [Neobacillus sp. Marseille-QA0830]